MEKKSSAGVKIFSILHMLSVFPILYLFRKYGLLDLSIVSILVFSLSIGILYLKNTARILLLFLDVVYGIALLLGTVVSIKYIMRIGFCSFEAVLPYFFSLLLLSLFIASIYYFTRPSVKEQFK